MLCTDRDPAEMDLTNLDHSDSICYKNQLWLCGWVGHALHLKFTLVSLHAGNKWSWLPRSWQSICHFCKISVINWFIQRNLIRGELKYFSIYPSCRSLKLFHLFAMLATCKCPQALICLGCPDTSISDKTSLSVGLFMDSTVNDLVKSVHLVFPRIKNQPMLRNFWSLSKAACVMQDQDRLKNYWNIKKYYQCKKHSVIVCWH